MELVVAGWMVLDDFLREWIMKHHMSADTNMYIFTSFFFALLVQFMSFIQQTALSDFSKAMSECKG